MVAIVGNSLENNVFNLNSHVPCTLKVLKTKNMNSIASYEYFQKKVILGNIKLPLLNSNAMIKIIIITLRVSSLGSQIRFK